MNGLAQTRRDSLTDFAINFCISIGLGAFVGALICLFHLFAKV